ncbi:hypothetical protein BDV24DRAFT_52049 [Aspergillus arachidicola]|uniref:Uncharacterized protein n=1 Tax=Aspergillus arachidicola TaxID=656916 RepID=A0A5N6YN26_9EURO|nr:hypothetical protein BDV24DRAFT_52049 [Aspergillus arachidicola]
MHVSKYVIRRNNWFQGLGFRFSHCSGLFAIFLLSHSTNYSLLNFFFLVFLLSLPTISCQQIIKSGNQVSSYPGITGV